MTCYSSSCPPVINFAHKIIHHSESVPEIFIGYLNSNDCVHTHKTRTKMIGIFLQSLLDTDLDSLFKIQNLKLWNELPKNLKELTSLNNVKKN